MSIEITGFQCFCAICALCGKRIYMKYIFSIFLLVTTTAAIAQKENKKTSAPNNDSIAPVGIIKNISDSELLDIVQRQTFRFFWHYAHPVSGLARERDNTVRG